MSADPVWRVVAGAEVRRPTVLGNEAMLVDEPHPRGVVVLSTLVEWNRADGSLRTSRTYVATGKTEVTVEWPTLVLTRNP